MTVSDLAAPVRAIERRRFALKARALTVQSRVMLSASLVRLVLQGDLGGFESDGFDDHIKLILPRPGEATVALPELTADGPRFDEPRPVMRDYTPRAWDIAAGTLTIDFALHEAGPASDWARAAQPGDPIGVAGPRGSLVISADFSEHLLIGDETALPAIARRLEALPPAVRATAIIEVGDASSELALSSPARSRVIWVHRNGAPPGESERLSAALRAHVLSGEPDLFAWAAAESTVAKALRTILIAEKGLAKLQVKAAGYWRRGASGVHDHIEDDAG